MVFEPRNEKTKAFIHFKKKTVNKSCPLPLPDELERKSANEKAKKECASEASKRERMNERNPSRMRYIPLFNPTPLPAYIRPAIAIEGKKWRPRGGGGRGGEEG